MSIRVLVEERIADAVVHWLEKGVGWYVAFLCLFVFPDENSLDKCYFVDI